MMVHQDYKELLTAKALNALDAEDARALETHLQSCADCRAELIGWEETAALLSLAADVRGPSDELRGRILESLGTTANSAEAERSNVTGPVGSSRDSKVLEFERPRRSVFSSGSSRAFGAIAAALVLVTLLASLLLLWQQNRRAQAEMARLSAQIELSRSQLARERAAMELLTSPGARMAKLAGTKDAPGAQAMIAYNTKGHAMLMARGLPAVPEGMAYQLWFIKDGKKMPGKVLMPDATGNGIMEDEIPEVAREAGVFALTLEPQSGVQVPTGAIYLISAT
jgi:anti-sigma-K factor RskA